jgi:hypothetical protein
LISISQKKALLLGIYENSEDKENFIFSNNGIKFNDKIDGKLKTAINV